MYRSFLFVFFIVFSFKLNAQQLPLLIQLDEQKKPFLLHTVAPKENLYSIGRIYNISPRVYAPYNGLTIDSGLSIGRIIKIPLTESNYWRTGSRKATETILPVHHVVSAKETLFGVSQLYKVDRSSLTSWNNLSSDQLSVGTQLIVGYLKVDKNLSPLANQGVPARAEPNFKSGRNNAVKDTTPSQEVVKQPEVKKEVIVAAKDTPVISKETTVIDSKVEPSDLTSNKGFCFFKDEYLQQTKQGTNIQSKQAKGGSFKSTSGWSDGKFYMLIDGIEKGTIVKLINPVAQQIVFAKVLASIAETKPGAKEEFLISNAAADQLGVSGEMFTLEIAWEK
ncbi:MAG: LysM peptidoglycan-binding domain-containing protein [Bacteroidetes bacterium]|nr:LysM peptidoglycan-binding domain-containing protein [Bacteroidota bacterium]